MAIITEATWADLGYQRLGPGPRLNVDKTKMLAQFIKEREAHEVQTAGDERWLRDKARVLSSTVPWFVRRAATISKATVDAPNSYDFLERAVRGPYAKKHGRVTPSWTDLVSMTVAHESEPRWRWLHRLALVSSLSGPDDVAKLLREHVLPAFFHQYPAGRVAFYESNYDFERRYGLLRGMYALSQYELADIKDLRAFKTLQQWQTLDTVKQSGTLFSLLGTALYPHVHFVDAGLIGLRMLFNVDPAEKHEPPPFPSSWMSFAQSRWAFGEQQRNLIDVLIGKDEAAHDDAAHRRFRMKGCFSTADIEMYVDWFVEKYSRLAFHLSDPCEFIVNGCIDAVTTFEFAITVDRVLRKAVSCVASEENPVRKAASQETADLLETLRAFKDPSATGTFFKKLHHRDDGLALVQKCLASVPTAVGAALQDSAQTVYRDLHDTIRNSVWVKSKLTERGVMVKNKDLTAEREEPTADFVTNVVRALRNAHHGYLSTSDTSNRPSRYLALVTGNTPDSMAYLGTLWALALVASPEEMLGRTWQSLAAWP